MALPNSLNSASPAGSAPPTAATDIRALTLAITDIFGIADNTAIAAAAFAITAAGLTVVKFQDLAASPATAGFLQRNGNNLEYFNTAARVLYMQGGTDVAVADGGTGLSAGTSGGVLYYSAAGTLASSAALTASALLVGGGAGATPTALAAATNGQIPIGRTGLAPTVALPTNGTNLSWTGGSGTLTGNATDRVIIQCFGLLVTTGTEYLGGNHSTTEANVSFSSPVTGNVKAMSCHASSGSGTYTLVVNGSDTAITRVGDGSATGTVAVTAGQSVSVKLTGATASTNHMVTVSIEATS
jgi:hypothetical protein